jgi:hypothetical protein
MVMFAGEAMHIIVCVAYRIRCGWLLMILLIDSY